MSERLDQASSLSVGTRDAVHVPIIVINAKGNLLAPGMWIRFTNESCNDYEVCNRENAHGIINPFISKIRSYDSVVVFLVPGITTPVQHNFDIVWDKAKMEHVMLELELAEIIKNEPNCAECYYIENGSIQRT
jgi:hypothetical protein